MIKKMIRLILAFCTGMLLSKPVYAQAAADTPEDITGIFCEAMHDAALYDKYNYDSYKMLVAGKDGWIFRSESDLRTDFTLTDEALKRLSEMNESFKKQGTELVMFMMPTRSMMHYDYLKEEDRKRYSIENIDMVWRSYENTLASIKSKGIHVVGIDRAEAGQPFYYKRDHHWGPEGARFSAKKIAAYVKKIPAYDNVRKVGFVTHNQGSYEFEGVSKKVFSELCNTLQPPEKITYYKTERSDTATAQNALFGEAVNPEIVLLGTSNSTMIPSYSNFEGFLMEALSADILNMSVSGGGLDTAMISYLNSPFFKERPASIAIWEIPGNYNLSEQKNFFREAVPAIYGSCQEPVELTEDAVITDKNMLVMDRLEKKKIRGSDYYLNLIFEKPVTRSFSVDLRYEGSRDKYKFYRSNRTPNDNQFFLELKDDKKDYLKKVALYLPATLLEQTIDVKICKKSNERSFFAFSGDRKEPNFRENVVGLLQKLRAAINF